jgi:hypothetical protein
MKPVNDMHLGRQKYKIPENKLKHVRFMPLF